MMTSANSNLVAALGYSLLLLSTQAQAGSASDLIPRTSRIFEELRAGGFSGALGRGVEIRFLGDITEAPSLYELYAYSWTQPRSEIVGVQHASYRLLVFRKVGSKETYLGSYPIDSTDVRLKGNTLVFSEEFGDQSASFGPSGPLRSIILDGEERDFDK